MTDTSKTRWSVLLGSLALLASCAHAEMTGEDHRRARGQVLAPLDAPFDADDDARQPDLIVCALRHHTPRETERAARLAVHYRDQGVVGFDLAGPEAGHPPSDHAAAFALAHDAGLPITCHAGEADEAMRVIEAARLGARRIGHGVRLADALVGAEGQALLDEARARRLHLEVCVTSNLHTGAAVSRATHPIRALWDAGIELSFHTDSRLLSGVSATSEAASLVREGRFSFAELASMSQRAAQASFMPEAVRTQAQAAIRAWAWAGAQAAAAATPSSRSSTP